MPPHVLRQLPEQHPEQSPQQWPRQVQPLLPEVIPVVLVGASQLAHQQLVNSVPHEESLFGLAVFLGPHVRKHLLLQYPCRVPDAIVLRDVLRRSPPPYEVQRYLLLLYHERLLEGRPEEVHHLPVREVVHHVLDDVAVGDVPQRAEYNHHGDVGANVRKGGSDLIPLDGPLPPLLVHLYVQRGGGPRGVFHLRSRLDDPRELGRLLLAEGVDVVVAHPLLRHDDLLASVDHEVPPLVVDALPQVSELGVVLIAQDAEEGTEHDGDVAQELLAGLLRGDGASHVLGGVAHVGVASHAVLVHGHIHVEGGRVS
mmetsp:Transcript_52108/g.110741  ORF Transcript_52108/g.110741 Transcript_52108/m.110741 type:complete len:312 (-) Transcript_52108:640-1575(-)